MAVPLVQPEVAEEVVSGPALLRLLAQLQLGVDRQLAAVALRRARRHAPRRRRLAALDAAQQRAPRRVGELVNTVTEGLAFVPLT